MFSEEAARVGLSFLTTLTQLTQLVGFFEAGDDALAEFWAVVGNIHH